MSRHLPLASLIPAGLTVDSIVVENATVLITARRSSGSAACPLCKSLSGRVHCCYERWISDLPCAGRTVRIRLMSRRFRCQQEACRRRIFVERFGDRIVPPRSRRTMRLDNVVHCIGLALGGRPRASIAKRLMVPVSNDTLLRTVRRRGRRSPEPLKVVGIDDWLVKR